MHTLSRSNQNFKIVDHQTFPQRFFAHMGRAGTTLENTLIGAFAAAGAASVMIPFDTVKTRMVMQSRGEVVYSGMIDCFAKVR
jgi:Mitochondrial carrier protein